MSSESGAHLSAWRGGGGGERETRRKKGNVCVDHLEGEGDKKKGKKWSSYVSRKKWPPLKTRGGVRKQGCQVLLLCTARMLSPVLGGLGVRC